MYKSEYSYRFVSNADELRHSSGPWKKHKYLKKIGNRYIYNLKEKIGLNARDRYNKADATVQAINARQNQDLNKSWQYKDQPGYRDYAQNLTNERERAERDRARAQKEYEKTIMGRIAKHFKRKITTSAHDVSVGLRGESFVWEVGKGKRKKK